ncbi:related to cell wall protein UTR2 [Cephalotrichum gorgonifer]|uniref:Crh-like protein n=1 Tax=Cephalotrichum gorgonifer TaxID=2041049 RepID=A0AAE8N0G7_9PEZI|nr:related to cell wall protein UTR2 [Cephalotrichum gorgonifer]
MLASLLPLALTGLLHVAGVMAQDLPTCSLDKKCPKEHPCCSQYNQCGVGAFCLGGCDPRMSYSLDSCMPAPVCESKTYKMDSMDKIVSMDKYLGDASKADWMYQGKPLEHNGNILLTMPPQSVGTVMASTSYMWYGRVKAKLKTARGRGVVTAFILYSDVKDEIDYEFVGVDLETAQTNYYFQGIPLYDQGGNITIDSDSYDNWHEYEINWTPDKIEWAVDGKVGRTKKRSDTWNETFNQWDFPQTPSRVQLSIWPGGLATNAKGTIDWAGGEIDWNSDDIKKNQYYFATFGEITVECWDADSGPGSNNGKSYIYTDFLATNNTVEVTDKKTTLKSLEGSGIDQDNEGTGKGNAATLPGGDVSGSGSSGSGNHDQSGSGGSTGGCGANSFSQSCSNSGNSDGSGDDKGGAPGARGSASLGVVIAVAALLLI